MGLLSNSDSYVQPWAFAYLMRECEKKSSTWAPHNPLSCFACTSYAFSIRLALDTLAAARRSRVTKRGREPEEPVPAPREEKKPAPAPSPTQVPPAPAPKVHRAEWWRTYLNLDRPRRPRSEDDDAQHDNDDQRLLKRHKWIGSGGGATEPEDDDDNEDPLPALEYEHNHEGKRALVAHEGAGGAGRKRHKDE